MATRSGIDRLLKETLGACLGGLLLLVNDPVMASRPTAPGSSIKVKLVL